jgi:hypothetical protein
MANMKFPWWLNPWPLAMKAQELGNRLHALMAAESEAGRHGLKLLAENEQLRAMVNGNVWWQAASPDTNLEFENARLKERLTAAIAALDDAVEARFKNRNSVSVE